MVDNGAPQEERLVLDKKALAKWLGWGLVAAAVIAVIALYNSPGSSEKRAANEMAKNAPLYAEMACKDQVKARLKAPSTAEFSDVEAVGYAGSYTVTGNVDAENSFGAALRSTFSCDVVVEGDLTKTSNVLID